MILTSKNLPVSSIRSCQALSLRLILGSFPTLAVAGPFLLDMDTEIRLLRELSENSQRRSSRIGESLGILRHDVLAFLEQLEREGIACQDLNQRWSLSPHGEQILATYALAATTAFHVGIGDVGVPDPAPEEPEQVSLKTPTSDESTREAIRTANVQARILVCAGPGMGKTHLACGRISHLVASGVDANRILVVSFSRAAVQVMRERSGHDPTLDAVTIRTLDSLAATLHQQRSVPNSYRESIELALETRSSWAKNVRDIWSHVIIDEAQDIIGVRARLLDALLSEVTHSEWPTGFTVLHDPAQAIYDFTRDDNDSSDLVTFLRQGHRVDEYQLTVVHRSSDPSLLQLMASARPAVLEGSPSASERLRTRLNEETRRLEWSGDFTGELWVFRSRVEVVDTISRLDRCGSRCPVQLRMGGVGDLLDPDLARTLNGCLTWPHVTREEWRASAAHQNLDGARADEIFSELFEFAASGADRVDMTNVARRLATSSRVLPVLATRTPADALTLAVIHAAKGTEADHVRYIRHDSPLTPPEEARVAHVALSRARTTLEIHKKWTWASRCKTRASSEREWFKVGRKKTLRMLICAPEDVDERENLGIHLGETHRIQDYLASFTGPPRPLKAIFDGSRYLLSTAECASPVGALSELVTQDIENFFGSRFRSHGGLGGLFLIGTRTVFQAFDVSAGRPLRTPLHRTQAWLAPVVVGLAAPYSTT